jgi:hypothetical protein
MSTNVDIAVSSEPILLELADGSHQANIVITMAQQGPPGPTGANADRNIDGGSATTVYLPSQNIDGGASSG